MRIAFISQCVFLLTGVSNEIQTSPEKLLAAKKISSFLVNVVKNIPFIPAYIVTIGSNIGDKNSLKEACAKLA
jgi:hypothetical protein